MRVLAIALVAHALLKEPTKSTKPVFQPPKDEKEPTKSTKPVFQPPVEKEHALQQEPTKSTKPVFEPPKDEKEPTKSTKPVFQPPVEKEAANLVKESATTVEKEATKAEEPEDVHAALQFDQWIQQLKAQKLKEDPAGEGSIMDKVDGMLEEMCEGRESAPAECDKFKEQITELHDTVAEHHEEHVKAKEEEAAPSVEPGKAEAELSSETKVTLKDVVEHEPVITRIPSAAPPSAAALVGALLALVFLHA